MDLEEVVDLRLKTLGCIRRFCFGHQSNQRRMGNTPTRANTFGTHTNGHTMTRKILRAGYYWLTMESDCYQYAKRCHKCQIYADRIHVPPSFLNILSSPWPFSMWG